MLCNKKSELLSRHTFSISWETSVNCNQKKVVIFCKSDSRARMTDALMATIVLILEAIDITASKIVRNKADSYRLEFIDKHRSTCKDILLGKLLIYLQSLLTAFVNILCAFCTIYDTYLSLAITYHSSLMLPITEMSFLKGDFRVIDPICPVIDGFLLKCRIDCSNRIVILTNLGSFRA